MNSPLIRRPTILCGISLCLTLGLGILHAQRPDRPSGKKPPETVYPQHLTGAFTGGFGEDSCHFCHFDYPLNPEGGQLSVTGLRDDLSPGQKIQITVQVSRKKLGRAGFQLTARFADGRQAGRFLLSGRKRIQTTQDESIPDSVQYLQHTPEGVQPVSPGQNRWKITWQAPARMDQPVLFHIAANAANGDKSEFGDFIFTREIEVPPNGRD